MSLFQSIWQRDDIMKLIIMNQKLQIFRFKGEAGND